MPLVTFRVLNHSWILQREASGIGHLMDLGFHFIVWFLIQYKDAIHPTVI